MKRVDRLVKGLAACFALIVALTMTAGSGGCLNPALGLAESIYMIGLDNRDGATLGNEEAKYMWVYIFGPFIGGLIAALFFVLHSFIDRNAYKQNEPMQFIGLLKSENGS
jgi:glycerol uptake facilitator-like aquaporin